MAKRIEKNKVGIDRAKFYNLDEAVKLVKERANAKFNETIEVAMNLGVDPRHADQMVRGVVNLPNGTGRSVCVGVFVKGAKADEAKARARKWWARKNCSRSSARAPSISTVALQRRT